MQTIFIDPKDFQDLLGSAVSEKTLPAYLDLVKGEFKGTDPDGQWRVELNDTNRPDLWSAEGIARQLRAAQGKRRDYPFFSGAAKHEIRVMDTELKSIRPFVAAFIVRGLDINEAALVQMIQTQEKLAEVFGRKRKDVAIGIYAAKKVKLPVRYIAAKPNDFEYIPLGFDHPMRGSDILEKHPKGVMYREIFQGFSKVPLLRDDSNMILSMPPIINSRTLGEVQPGDSDLFVEGTGNNINQLVLALNILACDLADRGGRIERIKTVFPYDTPLGREVVLPGKLDNALSISIGEFVRLLGIEVKAGEVDSVLEQYGCDVSVEKETIVVTPPPTRNDYLHPVDVVEDFAIARGYQTFQPCMPKEFTLGKQDQLSLLENTIRDCMLGMGYEEMISNILVSKNMLRDKMNLGDEPMVEVANVMNESYAALRDSIIPSLLEIESHSASALYPHRIFEVGEAAVFDLNAPHGSYTQVHLSGLVAHNRATLSEIHADVEFLLQQMGLDIQLAETSHPSFLPGRVAKLMLHGTCLGVLGEIHPIVLEKWDILMPVLAFELNLNTLLHE